MKKFLYLLIMPLLSFAFSSCNDDDPMNAQLIKGSWKEIATDNFGFTTVYTFETTKNLSNYGTLEVKYLHTDGSLVEEMPVKNYDWHAAGPQNNDGVPDITITPSDIDADDPGFFYETYIITDLTHKKMIWRGLEPSSITNKAIEFRRI